MMPENQRQVDPAIQPMAEFEQLDTQMEESAPDLLHLFNHELSDIRDAETQLLQLLPEINDGIESTDLRERLSAWEGQIAERITRLKQFEVPHSNVQEEHCEGMEGLLEEVEEVLEQFPKGAVCDAALICSLQKISHYKIAGYGSLQTYATHLDLDTEHTDLARFLAEETELDRSLTLLAESGINFEALNASEDNSNK